MTFRKKVFQDWYNLFKDIPKTLELETKEGKYYKIILPYGIVWRVGVGISYIGNKWYIHYFNNFYCGQNDFRQNMVDKMLGDLKTGYNNKINLLHAFKKNDYNTYLNEFSRFQQNINFTVLPQVWEDNDFGETIYYLHWFGQEFIIELQENTLEEANNFLITNMTEVEKIEKYFGVNLI